MQSDSSRFAVEELMAQAGWVRALALRLAGNPSEAEDLAQDALTVALEHRPRTDRGLRPWLARVLRTRRAWFLRLRAARRAREEIASRSERVPSAGELAARAEVQRRLVDDVLGLDEPYRSLVVLRYYGGLEPSEIARRLGKPPGSVRGQLSRALDMLRASLGASRREGEPDWRSSLLLFGAGIRPAPPAGPGMAPTSPIPLITMQAIAKITLAAAAGLGALTLLWLSLRSEDDARLAPGRAAGADGPLAAMSAGEARVGAEAAPAASLAQAAQRSEGRVAATSSVESHAGEPVRGVLVNRNGGAAEAADPPLGSFLFDLLRGEERLETLVTDSEGCFETERAYTSGTFTLKLRGHARSDPHVYLPRLDRPLKPAEIPAMTLSWTEGEELLVRVDTRLVLPIRLRGPAEVADRVESVQLVSRARRDIAGPGAHPRALRAPIHRDESGEWVRFHRNGLPGSSRWFVHAETPDGLWRADTEIAVRGGHRREPIPLVLESAGRIDVVVPFPSASDPSSIAVLVGLPGTDRGRLPAAAVSCGAQARRFRLGGLYAGDHRIVCYADGTEVVRAPVAVVPGEVSEVTVELAWPVALHPVRLELGSQTGRFHEPVSFAALPVAPEGDSRRYSDSMVEWTQGEDRRWSGTQSLGRMPPGEYRLELMASFGFQPWDHHHRTLTVPGPTMELTCLDGSPSRSFGLRVVDRESGVIVEEAALELSVDGLPGPVCDRLDGLFRLEDVPLGSDVRWSLRAEGYEPREGGLDLAAPEGELWVVAVELTRER